MADAKPDLDPDPGGTLESPRPPTSEGEPPPPPPLPPAVRRPEEGAPGEDRSGPVTDCAGRVLGLLGMGHRLFVPRLLAVREQGFAYWEV